MRLIEASNWHVCTHLADAASQLSPAMLLSRSMRSGATVSSSAAYSAIFAHMRQRTVSAVTLSDAVVLGTPVCAAASVPAANAAGYWNLQHPIWCPASVFAVWICCRDRQWHLQKYDGHRPAGWQDRHVYQTCSALRTRSCSACCRPPPRPHQSARAEETHLRQAAGPLQLPAAVRPPMP